MKWNSHSEIKKKHSILSASKYGWSKFRDPEQYKAMLKSAFKKDIGTALHEYAADRINYKLKMQKADKNALLAFLLKKGFPRVVLDIDAYIRCLVPYVNDAIAFRMDAEVELKYSDVAFSTTDCISLRKQELRIHDLKTGKAGSFEQLLIYAAYCCLEYNQDPFELKTELRLYRTDSVEVYTPEPEEILEKMDSIRIGSTFVESMLS